MDKQRLDEWNIKNLSEKEINYHSIQWKTPKNSTKKFEEYISENIKKSRKIIDLGCGQGGSTYYISKKK